jgi:DNA processing protein
MKDDLSLNTRAILLLTAPLIVGGGRAERPLSPRDYSRLAIHLRDTGRQPADLLTEMADEVIHDCRALIDPSHIRPLLQRGFLLSQAVERWRSRAIWVISRADAEYPVVLKRRLAAAAPAVLYGCGDVKILGSGGLAVVGSREVDDSLVAYAERLGELVARSGKTVVSGGARGIDQAAMRGAIQAGGSVVGVLPDGLERAALNREHRGALLERRLALVSPYDPAARFLAGHAMQRNKLIYALADAALVVSSDLGKGGTWAGATEQLDKLQFVPVYVRSTGETQRGLEALRERGAESWPNPATAADMTAVLRAGEAHVSAPVPAQSTLWDDSPHGGAPLT